MATPDEFDALTTDAVNEFRKPQNQNTSTKSIRNDDEPQSVVFDQFLEETTDSDAASQGQRTSNSTEQMEQMNMSDDPKNVVIVMQQSVPQQQEQTILQDLSSITTNNTVMASPPLTWAKTENLAADDSVTFLTPSAPLGQRADRKSAMVQQLEEQIIEDTGACLVCGDRASGYHYSVFSCEGCKGFFKRSVQKALSYTCKENASCPINKYSRNSCQFCRFKKCLEIGMKREAVREDRSPGGKHRHKRHCLEHVGGLVQALSSDEPFRESTVQSATDSYAKQQRLSEPTSPTGAKVSDGDPEEHPLLNKLLSARPNLCPKGASEKTDGLSVNELMQYGYLELRFIIEWAKKVPGFSELCLSDQMSLLKASFMELNVLRLAYRSMYFDNKIKFAEDVILPLDYCESIGWGKELVDGIIDFAHKLKEIALELPEFCILNAIILMYPDANSLEDKVRISKLQSQILDSLRILLLQRHPNDQKRLGKILLRLPALRTVSAKAAERFLSLTFDGSVELNDLVLEMMN